MHHAPATLRREVTSLRKAIVRIRKELSRADSGFMPVALDRSILTAAFKIVWKASHQFQVATDTRERGLPSFLEALRGPGESDVDFGSDAVIIAEHHLKSAVPPAFWESLSAPGLVYELLSEQNSARRGNGQYYTPDWAVQALVRLCLSAVESRTIDGSDMTKGRLRVLDPACGCGAFLIGVEQAMVLSSSPAYESSQGGRQGGLTALRPELVGIDIDPVALRVADASLRLLEAGMVEERSVALTRLLQADFLQQGPDEDSDNLTGPIPSGGHPRSREAGSDLVIGNPPYLGFHHHPPTYRRNFLRDYAVFDGKADLFYYFIERGLTCLVEGGVLGYIVPQYWLGADKARKLRAFVAANSTVEWVVNLERAPVFERAGVQVCLLVLKKTKPASSSELRVARARTADEALAVVKAAEDGGKGKASSALFSVPQRLLGEQWVLIPRWERDLISRMESVASQSLGDVASVSPGLITGADRTNRDVAKWGKQRARGVYVLTEKEVERLRLSQAELALVKPWVKNSHVQRWRFRQSGLRLLYIDRKPDPDKMPKLSRHLKSHRALLGGRYDVVGSQKPWWRIVRPRKREQFESDVPKLLVPYKARVNRFAVDYEGRFCSADVYCINPKPDVIPEYLCCLLNSQPLAFYLRCIAKKMGHLYEYYAHTLVRLPVKVAEREVQEELKLLHDALLAEFDQMSSSERQPTAEIRGLEQRIDERVADVYELRLSELPGSPF